jgi:hypothetical protein
VQSVQVCAGKLSFLVRFVAPGCIGNMNLARLKNSSTHLSLSLSLSPTGLRTSSH